MKQSHGLELRCLIWGFTLPFTQTSFNPPAPNICWLHSRPVVQITLEELQLGRSLLHRQAEAAIQEADAQIKLNKGQYDHVGRMLVHVKVANHA